ncbi:hypothetical protein ACFL6U_08855 [Planctomycetota bacterium]
MNKKTTFGVSSEKLSRLFAIRPDEEEAKVVTDENDRMVELLQDHLMQPLPSKDQSDLQQTIAFLTEDPIGQLLTDPDTDLTIIRRIKDYGRHISRSAKSRIQERVGRVVYYTAIAHALVYGQSKITKHIDDDLAVFFTKLANERWIPKDLTKLLHQARDECQVG